MFSLIGQKESQPVYKTVKVGFLYTDERIKEVVLQIKISIKGKDKLVFFFKVNLSAG